MHKVACGVILYYPNKRKAISDISRYSTLFDKVVVFDNTDEYNKEIQEKLSEIANVCYISEGRNTGLPYAYNSILDIVKDCDFLCALDQDSLYNSEDIHEMLGMLDYTPKDAAVIGPHVIYNGEDFVKSKKFIKRRYVITSGCFINLNIMHKEKIIFDENYFIDKFEVDLDMQFRKLGYAIYEYENACLYQRLGTVGKNGKSNHSSLRHYYLFRNRFYFNNKYFSPFKRTVLNILQTSRQLWNIILFEENKLLKLKQLPIAIKDYLNGRMGEYVY
ncbi:glycosyltransferase [Ligilactobacillus ruminis]|uniref:glycosyltransferase n=1 Tax=Ligilactobacillus ruminis TaxID=1623 RepID=UPI0034A29596